MRTRLTLSKLFLVGSLCLFGSNAAEAALSATTANTIEGTAPYLTFDGGTTKATDTSSLLGIKLSDGTEYTKLTNPSSALLPIELPVAGETFADIDMLVPVGQTAVNLSTLIGAPYNYWGDDDGDGNVNATGTLSLSITDANNNPVARTDTPSPCTSAYYKVILTSTSGNLSTQYGAPNSTIFNGDNATYYIKPKITAPYACYAKPNLDFDYGTQPEWVGGKGFLPQNVAIPGRNFPTMGFNGAYFDLTVAGVLGSTVTASPATSGNVTIKLTAQSASVVRVTLEGPSHSSPGVFIPSTFELKSGTTKIYSFKLSKWFIAKPGPAGGHSNAQTYCSGLPGYHVPGVRDYTNANGNGWTGGLAGWSNNYYARAIGGGLFAEWGYTYNGYYTGSDFETHNYWVSEQAGSTASRHDVTSDVGFVSYTSPSYSLNRAACISP